METNDISPKPRKPTQSKRSYRIQICLTPSERQALVDQAERAQLTLADLIRQRALGGTHAS